jgi:hypothetical protein
MISTPCQIEAIADETNQQPQAACMMMELFSRESDLLNSDTRYWSQEARLVGCVVFCGRTNRQSLLLHNMNTHGTCSIMIVGMQRRTPGVILNYSTLIPSLPCTFPMVFHKSGP